MSTEEGMKATGCKMSGTAEDLRCTRTVKYTLGNSKTVKLKVWAYFSGQTENRMMVNGNKVKDMEKVSGKVIMTTSTSATGKETKLMVMEHTPGLTETDMMANGYQADVMEEEKTFLLMGIPILVSTKKECLMVKVFIPGKTAVFTMVLFKMVLNMAKAIGGKTRTT